MNNKPVIYHNPQCSTSRKVLEALVQAGHEPTVIEYLKNPLNQQQIQSLLAKMNQPALFLVRQKEPEFTSLHLDQPDITEEELIDAMARHPKLMNRPIVETQDSALLCRPSELVFDFIHNLSK